ncbi:MAG TPA: DNA mismatch repair endonuclease MutL [Turneriella sp.]|nr:DNA mismatch repair endonuclease MutL [Turneriella sp.]
MKRIQKLNETLIAQIAAGEVIESPAAIIKELVENSLDANATEIDIRVVGDGFSEIQIRDNGDGIHANDLFLAVDSFATSKITSFDELTNTTTMGFRGEALGSIAAVSRLTIESKVRMATQGASVHVDETGRHLVPSPIREGTRVVVRDLFYNVPVRRDYYQNRPKVLRQITDTLTQITIAHPTITFRYAIDNKEPVYLPASQNLIERLTTIFGESIRENLIPLYYEENGLTLEGYISKFYFYRNHAGDIRLWVNKRPVQYKPLVMLLRHVYGELMPKGRFPFAALFFSLAPREVDANVHPQKREVRFKQEARVQNFLRQAFVRTIGQEGGISAASMVAVSGGGGSPTLEKIPQRIASEKPATPVILLEHDSPFKASQLFDFQPEISTSAFPENLTLHTRIFNTFIVATNPEGIFLIDQHTAHERINYEHFQDLLAEKKDISQRLLHSIPIMNAVFTRSQFSLYKKTLLSLGFETTDLGPAGFALTAVPGYVDTGEELDAFETALHIVNGAEGVETADLFDQLAKDLSCRHAIRKGETASLADFREQIEKLKLCRMPLRCPHGRPTVIRIDEKEIFAYFKRQV